MRAKAIPHKIADNERVVMTRWQFAPGAETGWHCHVVNAGDAEILMVETELK